MAKWDDDRDSLAEEAVAVADEPANPPDPFPLDVGADSNILVLNMETALFGGRADGGQ